MTPLATAEQRALVDAVATGDWSTYKLIVVAFSGGKDSLACVLRLLDLGCPKDKIELWHHDVDGEHGDLMDWPVTRAYCRAVADHLGLALRFSWKEGGFEREMLRHNTPTAPTHFDLANGTVGAAGGKGPGGTREKFPQVSADLKVRWCSAYLKIDVCAAAIRNDPRFADGSRYLVVSGERRQESGPRSKYAEMEADRTMSKSRNVHRWRAVIDLGEDEVWELIKSHNIDPHPAYVLGFGRVSCMACIFGNADQWATVRDLDPDRFERIAEYEKGFGVTIKRNESVREAADRGSSLATSNNAAERQEAMSRSFYRPVSNGNWTLPAGAFKECGGPT